MMMTMMSSVRPRERHCPRLHDNRRRDARLLDNRRRDARLRDDCRRVARLHDDRCRDARLHDDRGARLQTAMRVYLALKQLLVFGQFAGSLYVNSLNETYKQTQVHPREPETPVLPTVRRISWRIRNVVLGIWGLKAQSKNIKPDEELNGMNAEMSIHPFVSGVSPQTLSGFMFSRACVSVCKRVSV